jgi:hypothetical protein
LRDLVRPAQAHKKSTDASPDRAIVGYAGRGFSGGRGESYATDVSVGVRLGLEGDQSILHVLACAKL